MKKLRITVEGRAFEVTVELLEDDGVSIASHSTPPSPPVAAAVPRSTVTKSPSAPKAVAGAAGADIASQVSGMIVSVDVNVGDQVSEGQQLVTIEAMKMNTYVMAPNAGKVTEVLAAKGKSVLAGDVLVRLT
jgi:biotin carboxyl carrier protein